MKKALLLALSAVFTLSCSGDKGNQELPSVLPQDDTAKPTVVTGDATDITNTSASISGSYADAPSQGAYDRGVIYGLSAGDLWIVEGLNSDPATSGSFTVQLGSLEPGTTYYYQAFISVWDEKTRRYVDVTGAVKSFTTTGQPGEEGNEDGLQYLGCYEMPAIDLDDDRRCSGSGPETWGSTYWYNYLTTNENQMVVTHTYPYDGKQYRNWTALIDKEKKAPQWSAFVMHKEAYPDKNVGRKGDWTYGGLNNLDPGIPAGWQQSVASSSYSRGHFVASDYRQACDDANWQTFYWTNQALQWQNNFNSGIWSSLEQAVSSHAPSGRDTLYITVGVLYEDPDKIIDTNQGIKVLAPSHFYKCLMKCSFDEDGAMTAAKGCAYLFTNESHSGTYSQGITSIDAVEQRSGWNFFANVPAELQATAEAQSSALW